MSFEENEKQKKKRREVPPMIPRDYESVRSDYFLGTSRAREIRDQRL